MVVDLHDAPHYPPGIREEADSRYVVRLLLRDNIKDVLQEMFLCLEQRPVLTMGKLLAGAAGAGKSTSLFLAAELARHNGFIVVYLMLGQLMGRCRAGVDMVAEVINNIFAFGNNTALLQQLGHEPPKVADIAFLGSLVNALQQQNKLPVLIALDQYNAVFNTSIPEAIVPVFDVFRSPFHQSVKAFTLAAVSSSFSPVGKFPDADYLFLERVIEPYNNAEWMAMVDLAMTLGQLPPDLDVEELRFRTGQVARLLTLAMVAHAARLDIFIRLDSGANLYYGERVSKLLAKARNSEHCKLVYTEIAALVARGFADLITTTQCQISGLFKQLRHEDGQTLWVPVCPAVLRALALYVAQKESLTHMVATLAADPGTSWRALELAISLRFAQSSSVTLRARHLLEKDSRTDEWPEIVLQTTGRYMQTKKYDVGGDVMKLGTAYVCAPGHPACDLVLLTTDRMLVFVQVSESSYLDHQSKVDSLWKSGRDSKSVLLAYAALLPPECHPLQTRIRRWHSHPERVKLPEGVIYLYISRANCTVLTRSVQCIKEHHDRMVHVVSMMTCPDELRKLLTSQMGAFAQYFGLDALRDPIREPPRKKPRLEEVADDDDDDDDDVDDDDDDNDEMKL